MKEAINILNLGKTNTLKGEGGGHKMGKLVSGF